MRFKATFILLGILVLLSAYVYFVEIQGKEKKDRIEEKASQLLALEQEDINKLSLKRANETITLERVDDEWYLISPVTAKGDANTVESFISTISETKKEREIETENDEVSLKDFGLLPALFTVIVEAEGGEADTVLFGEKNPTNLYIFARKPSNPNVFCTGTLVHTELQKTVFDLRDKTILPFDKESVHRIQIVSGNGEIVLARTDEIWMVESPIQAEADLQIVDSWLNNLHTSRIDRFEEENPTDYSSYGLDPPRIRLILTIGTDNTQKELLIGHRNNDEYYARDTALTPVFALDTTFVQDLDKDVFDFRDKTIAKIARDRAKLLWST